MNIELIDINKIKPDPKNPRKGVYSNDDLHNMASTFAHHSIIQPIEIDENNQIIIGELRWRAGKIAGLKQIPCIRKIGLTSEQRIERQLIENIHHQKVELGECIDELKMLLNSVTRTLKCNHDTGIKELAQRLGCNYTWLTEVLQIEKAPKKIKKEVERYYETKKLPEEERKGISVSQAIEIVKAPKIIQDDLLEKAKEGIPHKKLRKLRSDFEDKRITLKEVRKNHIPEPLNFRQNHIDLILKGRKTQTSRYWHNAKIGDKISIHLHEPDIAQVKVTEVEEKQLSEFTEEDAKQEGNYSLKEFKEVWKKIHGKWNPEDKVKIIHFEVIK